VFPKLDLSDAIGKPISLVSYRLDDVPYQFIIRVTTCSKLCITVRTQPCATMRDAGFSLVGARCKPMNTYQ
jgi:hypothetical protein